MSIIYQPSGKAREYSELACNLYTGCNHGCKYCYAPAIRRMTRDKYIQPEPRRNIVRDFEKDCKNRYKSEQAVLFCFMCDPYNELETELRITRECLKVAYKYKIPVKILTKSDSVLNDMDIIKKFEKSISVGMTLTFYDDKKSKEWEPGAITNIERLEVLKKLKENNVMTWASFEPVIEPEESLKIMEYGIKYIDYYKVGKLNNYQGIDKKVNWNDFLQKVVILLRDNKKPFYIKKDLREQGRDVKLYGNEVLQDDFSPDIFM